MKDDLTRISDWLLDASGKLVFLNDLPMRSDGSSVSPIPAGTPIHPETHAENRELHEACLCFCRGQDYAGLSKVQTWRLAYRLRLAAAAGARLATPLPNPSLKALRRRLTSMTDEEKKLCLVLDLWPMLCDVADAARAWSPSIHDRKP